MLEINSAELMQSFKISGSENSLFAEHFHLYFPLAGWRSGRAGRRGVGGEEREGRMRRGEGYTL